MREVRVVARRLLSERWSRETLQELRAVPWAWRMAPPAAGEVPQVIPHVAVEAEAPALPRGSAVLAPRRVQITQRLMEVHGYTAGCPRCSRVRANRTTAGSRHSEECRARFEAILRAAGDANIERADARINEHLRCGYMLKRLPDPVKIQVANPFLPHRQETPRPSHHRVRR